MHISAKQIVLAILFSSSIFIPLSTFGHHSALVFDRSKSMDITGKVTKFVMRSPHSSIRIEVEGDDGSTAEWPIEGGATGAMIKNGFDRNSVKVGDIITVKINPMRNGTPGGLMQGLVLAGGASFGASNEDYAAPVAEEARPTQNVPSLTAYVPPPAGETWQQRERKSRPKQIPTISNSPTRVGLGALDPENLTLPRAKPPFDVTGIWGFRGEREMAASYGSYEFKPSPQFTEKGQEIMDEYLSYAKAGKRYAEPTAFCYPAGMPRLMTRFGALMMLQYPTAIFLVSRLNNEYRVIYLDGRARQPANLRDPNWSGESLGSWDGDTLVVETEGFTDENHMMQQGVFTGDQLKITERISMINDGNTLKIDYTFVDPEHWVGEWKHTKFSDRILGADVKEANCLFEDNMALPGLNDGGVKR
jgi:hypothetical protein